MSSRKGSFLAHGYVAFALVTILFLAGAIYIHLTSAAGTSESQLSILNATPIVTAVTINGGSAITLIVNATKTVSVSFTVTDDNGCGQVFYSGNVTTTLYRSGVSSTCAVSNPSPGNLNTLNCYVVSTSTHNCPGANSTTTSANATSTFEVWYFANATDASSSYSTENWQSFVIAQDVSSTTNSTTSTGVELNTLLGIAVPSDALNYGSVQAGTDTGSTNQSSTIKNAGNSSTTINISGTALTSGSNSITTSSQHYATNTFTYGGAEQSLQVGATAVAGFLIPRPPLTSWATTTPLPTGTREHTSLVNNGYVYKIGGILGDSSITSSVLFASINATGSLGSWSTTTALPTGTSVHASVVNNNYIYVLGGLVPTPTATVLFALVNATGSLGSWATTTALPTGTSEHAAVAYNGYLYSIGGNVSGITSTVLFTPINTTGSIGTWSTTTALPTEIRSHTSVTTNGYLYVIGGTSAGGVTSTVNFAPINSTGSLGSWSTTTPLLAGSQTDQNHTSIVSNGLIYTLGGIAGSNATSAVLFTPINASGSIGAWSQTTALPTGTSEHAAVAYNGYLYSIGGNVSGITSTVLFTPINFHNTYWGLAVPAGKAAGTYTGTVTYTAVFSP